MDDTTDRPPAVPPPTAVPPGRPPLRRPREGRLLTGVAAGLADHLGIDVVIVRILIVVFTVVTQGLGLLPYVAAAIFVPAAEAGAPRVAAAPSRHVEESRDPLFGVGMGALVLGAVWLAGGGFGGGFVDRGSVLVPLLLVGFGLALWRAGDCRPEVTAGPGVPPAWATPPAATASPRPQYPVPYPVQYAAQTGSPAAPLTPTESSMSTETTTRMSSEGANADPADPADPAGPGGPGTGYGPPHGDGGEGWTPPPEPERRERSLLTRITLGVALVTVGVLWLLRVADVVVIGWGMILAAALLVIGIGLLIGSILGNARWLILAGALLAPVVLIAQLGPLPYLSENWTVDSRAAGEIRSEPETLAELEAEYQLGAGSVRLDLTSLDLAGEDVSLGVDVGAGEIRIVVPDDLEVTATARSGIGQVRLFDDRSAAGIGAGQQEFTRVPEGDARGRLELDLQVGLGEIRVETAPEPDARALASPARS